MDGIFTIPYSEFAVINAIQKHFKKSDGFSVYIPASRQQKGIDFIVHNFNTNRVLRFQVKSSRTYVHEGKPGSETKLKKKRQFRYHLWFNNFINRYDPGHCDYYILFGLFPVYTEEKNIKDDFWNTVVLCYSEKEMFSLLDRIKTKKESKVDRFFSYAFDDSDLVFNDRGLERPEDASEYLLKNKISSILSSLSTEKTE